MAGGQERILRGRIRSVQATKKITRAMELIASSRIVKAQQRVEASRPYAQQLSAADEGTAWPCHVAVGPGGRVYVAWHGQPGFLDPSGGDVPNGVLCHPKYWDYGAGYGNGRLLYGQQCQSDWLYRDL